MKKLLIILMLVFVSSSCLLPTSALESSVEIHTMEELINWYESDEESCYFVNDIVFDKYYEFYQTDIKKVIDTKEFSLIIKNGFNFDNSKLMITGSGTINPVVKLDSQGIGSTVWLCFLDLVATKGDALRIGETQEVEFYTSWANDFPVKIKAKQYAIMNYYSKRSIIFDLAKLTSETKDAVWMSEEAYGYLHYCEVNQQENLNNLQVSDSFLGGVISNDIEISYDIEFNEVLVKDMNDFDLSMAPIVEVEYEASHVSWDLTNFDKSLESNVVTGKIDIIPLFSPYLVGEEVVFSVIQKEASTLIDFDIHQLKPWYEDTYRPWFSVTYPLEFDRVYLEVYRTEELLFREYDISFDVESYYRRKDFNFLVRDFSNIMVDEIYYCRLRVEGGFYEGYSNFIRLDNWNISFENPFPEPELPPLLPGVPPVGIPGNPVIPPSNGGLVPDIDLPPVVNKPNKPIIKPDTSDPDDNKGGSGGHRGDQNREDVPEEDQTIDLTPEQIEGLEKTKEDIPIVIGDSSFTVSHDQIQQWQQSENVTVGIDENEKPYYQVDKEDKVVMDNTLVVKKESTKKDNSTVPLYVAAGTTLIFACGWFIHKRKYHEK